MRNSPNVALNGFQLPRLYSALHDRYHHAWVSNNQRKRDMFVHVAEECTMTRAIRNSKVHTKVATEKPLSEMLLKKLRPE